jgi:hypothetical protein
MEVMFYWKRDGQLVHERAHPRKRENSPQNTRPAIQLPRAPGSPAPDSKARIKQETRKDDTKSNRLMEMCCCPGRRDDQYASPSAPGATDCRRGATLGWRSGQRASRAFRVDPIGM